MTRLNNVHSITRARGAQRQDTGASSTTGSVLELVLGCLAGLTLIVLAGLLGLELFAIHPAARLTDPTEAAATIISSARPPQFEQQLRAAEMADTRSPGSSPGKKAVTADHPTLLRAPAYPVGIERVIDGDTFVVAGGEHVRILNIDTAEMPPRSRCSEEARLANAAKARLAELISNGRDVRLAPGGSRDRDPFGRLLRRIEIDGNDAGEILMSEGLAHPWVGHKLPWC